MSEYTPTTEEIRRAVTSFNEYFDHPRAAEFDADLFDRWLTEVKAQERKAERERIIKLLEDTPATRTTWIDDGISVYALDKDDFIELIKGEEQ